MNAKRYCYRTTHGDLNMHHRTSEKYIRNKILNFLLISFKCFGLVSNCSTSAFARVDHLCSSIRISLMKKTYSIRKIKNYPFNFQQCERIMQLVLIVCVFCLFSIAIKMEMARNWYTMCCLALLVWSQDKKKPHHKYN